MKIVIATPLFPPEIGGPATYTHELARRLCREHEITIVAYADNPEHIKETRLIAVSKNIFLPIRLWMYFYILLREAKNADVIYVQNAVAAGLPAAMVGMCTRVPVVLKFVGDEAWERATQSGSTQDTLDVYLSSRTHDIKSSIFITVQKFVLKHVSRVVPPSAFLKQILVDRYGLEPEKVRVNFNAVAERGAISHTPRASHQISVACRLVAWKHVDGIVRAVAELQKKFPDVLLKIAGEGPEKEKLQILVADLHLEKHVIFLGRISQDQARMLQQESAVHVLNSSYEGMPYEVLNAFAVGTPVVATNIGGTNEVVVDGQTGLLIKQGNTAELVAAIERIFSDEVLSAKLAAGGEKKLKEQFSWDTHIATLLAVFASLHHN